MNIKTIKQELAYQDGKFTRDPAFHVQIKQFFYGVGVEYAEGFHYADSEDGPQEGPPEGWDAERDDEEQEIEGYFWRKLGYVTQWVTIGVFFTRKGAESYIKADGHNFRVHSTTREVRIIVESFYRQAEMLAVREMLLGQSDKEEGSNG